MEPRFGVNFGDVRVHETSDLANSIQAQAFTHGQDVYFNAGKYNPGSSGGKELLAHELTHVVQQTAAHTPQQPSSVQKYAQLSIQRQDMESSGQQQGPNYNSLSSSNVDSVMWGGFYNEWLASQRDADSIASEIQNLVYSTPRNQNYRLTQSLTDLVGMQWSAYFALERAVRLTEHNAATASVREAAFDANQIYYDLTVLLDELRTDSSAWNRLLRARVFDFFAGAGQAMLVEAESLKNELRELSTDIRTLRQAIADAPQDIAEAFAQQGINVALGTALMAVTFANPPLGIVLSAANAGLSMVLDRCLGPTTNEASGISSDVNAVTGGAAGITETLAQGGSKLARGANALGWTSVAAGVVIDGVEINQAIARYENLPGQLGALNLRYHRAADRYKTLAPILQNYDLSIGIIQGLSQQADELRLGAGL